MLPTFLVIGAMKAGTTSLHHYLSAHPDITMSREKETRFFVDKERWGRGVGWYEQQFEGKTSVVGEVCAQHTFGEPRDTAAKIASVLPDAKLIYSLRHPIERMVSQYAFIMEPKPDNTMSLDDWLLTRTPAILTSCYALHLQSFLEHYDREQILLVKSEGLRDDRVATMKRIFEFVGVESDGYPWATLDQKHNVGTVKDRPIRDDVYAWLASTLHSQLEWLREFDSRFDGWGLL